MRHARGHGLGNAETGSTVTFYPPGGPGLVFLPACLRLLRAYMGTRDKANFGGGAIRKGGCGHQPDAPDVPSGAIISRSSWQRERAQRLARIFRCLDRGRQEGRPLRKMLIKHAWRWKDRCYKCDPARAIRFGRSTLLRLYYQWKRGGCTLASIALRYANANRKLPANQVLAVARLCAAPGVPSFAAAWRQVQNPLATYHAFRHAMPARVRNELASLCVARRRVEYLERRSQRAIAAFAATLSSSAK